MKTGMNNSVFATESGLGTAAILFGHTGSHHPARAVIWDDQYIYQYLSVFLVCLAIVASGVWDSGLTSTALTIAAFNTVFGVYGGWIVTFLSVTFGIGCLFLMVILPVQCICMLRKISLHGSSPFSIVGLLGLQRL